MNNSIFNKFTEFCIHLYDPILEQFHAQNTSKNITVLFRSFWPLALIC